MQTNAYWQPHCVTFVVAAAAAAVSHSFQAWYLPKAKNLLAFKNVSCRGERPKLC